MNSHKLDPHLKQMSARMAKRLVSRWRIRFLLRRLTGFCIALLLCSVWAAAQTPNLRNSSVTIQLKDSTKCQNNLVHLKDLATLSGDIASVNALESIAIGPSPAIGQMQEWTREDITRMLELRGLPANSIHWIGSKACMLSRTADVTTASATKPVMIEGSNQQTNAGSDDTEINSSQFKPAYVTPQVTLAAQRNVIQAVTNYLQTETGEKLSFRVELTIPSNLTKALSLRKNIIGVTGGQAPWVGAQQFEVLFMSGTEKATALIDANISLPPSVWAAIGPLPKGRILSMEDLKEVDLPSSGSIQIDDCFVEPSLIIGQELRRSVSTGQPLQRRDLGTPRIVNQNEAIEIQVIAGAIVAKTTGKALQSGGKDEVIEVEIAGNKKRLVARVTGPGLVEAIAAATTLP